MACVDAFDIMKKRISHANKKNMKIKLLLQIT